jgi:hypothetical protein
VNKNILVFGSNLAGRHGKGAALHAMKEHGAVYGVGEGLQGQSYGIPTKDYNIRTRPLSDIKQSVDTFIQFAKDFPELTFNVTPIGTGLAGYTHEQIAPMFVDAPSNCVFLCDEWVDIIDKIKGGDSEK